MVGVRPLGSDGTRICKGEMANYLERIAHDLWRAYQSYPRHYLTLAHDVAPRDRALMSYEPYIVKSHRIMLRAMQDIGHLREQFRKEMLVEGDLSK